MGGIDGLGVRLSHLIRIIILEQRVVPLVVLFKLFKRMEEWTKALLRLKLPLPTLTVLTSLLKMVPINHKSRVRNNNNIVLSHPLPKTPLLHK